jgi:hypothetical protein
MEAKLDVRPDHVHVVISGVFDLEAARDGILRIAQACRTHGLDRVLVDGRLITSHVPVMHRYELAKMLADETGVRLRMAIVVTRENMSSKTLEETARNLGVEVRTTDSMAEAMIFLDLMREGPQQ